MITLGGLVSNVEESFKAAGQGTINMQEKAHQKAFNKVIRFLCIRTLLLSQCCSTQEWNHQAGGVGVGLTWMCLPFKNKWVYNEVSGEQDKSYK